MRISPEPAASKQPLLAKDELARSPTISSLMRNPSSLSTNDVKLPQLLADDGQVEEQTVMQVEVVNDALSRRTLRAELATKSTFLTTRWKFLLITCIFLVGIAAGIGGLAYWIASPRVITQPYLLYGESCYMNSRSCDSSRMLWCPAGTCLCMGDFTWNATIQNCSCGQYQSWNGIKCQNYGYFGDPCGSGSGSSSGSVDCRPTLTCTTVVNQTYTTGQSLCSCDNATYLDTVSGSSTLGQCIPKISYGVTCKTNSDCQSWLGLACGQTSSGLQCQCGSTAYWNGATCAQNALGWEPCNTSTPCDTTRGLTCVSGTCQCDSYSYWDNVTTSWCQTLKTYAVSCQFTFQCNTTVGLSCPTNSTGCNCYSTSYAYMCDCQSGYFWDGQRCIARHSFNGTCPGQYACSSNLFCYLGHCICQGNMVWNNATANQCDCLSPTVWNPSSSLCV